MCCRGLFLRCNDAVHEALVVEHKSMSCYSCNHVLKPLKKIILH